MRGDVAYTPWPRTGITSPIINIPHQSVSFVTTDEPTLTHFYHPNSRVHMMVHFCVVYRFWQMYNDTSLWYRGEYFYRPKNPLLFPECHIVGITQYAVFSDWLLSLSNMHLWFLLVFLWLDSSFPLRAEQCSIVWMDHSLSIHLLKGIMVAPKLWQLWMKLLQTTMYRFCVDISFHSTWVKTKKHDCWIIW